MSNDALISVVVPAHNVAHFLRTTLDSVIAQTERRWECVVVDDGSEDETFNTAAEYERADGRIRALRIQHGGTSAARNHGFRHLAPHTQYVTFMDSDDVWLPDALETLLRALEHREDRIGSHGLAEFIDAHGQPLAPGTYAEAGRNRLGLEGRRLIQWPRDRPTTFDVLVNGNVLFPPGLILTRRSAYEMAGPFDERLHGPEDWDMLIRLSRLGAFEFVNRVILQYRRHDANLGARRTVPVEAWLVRCIAFHSPENSDEQRVSARRGWRAYQVHMTHDRLRSAKEAVARGDVVAALRHVARLPVYAWRYVRGYPRPRVVREQLTW